MYKMGFDLAVAEFKVQLSLLIYFKRIGDGIFSKVKSARKLSKLSLLIGDPFQTTITTFNSHTLEEQI